MADPIIRLDAALTSVQPGGQARVQVTIANTGTVVEGYQVQVLGPSAAWSRVEPAEVSVYPQQEATVTVTFQPPAGTSVPGGRQGYGVLARSTLDPQFSAAAEAVVEVTAVLSVQATITPVTSSGNWQGRHQLSLTNAGNDAVSLRVDAVDPDETLGFRIQPASVTLPPGGRAEVEVRAIAKRPMQWRTPARRPFRVFGLRADGQPVATAEAAFTQTPSGWIPVTTAVIVLLAVLIMFTPRILAMPGIVQVPQPSPPSLEPRGAPPKPTGLKVVAVDATSARVSWVPLESAQNYKLQRTDRTGVQQAEEPRVLSGERNVEVVKDLPAGELVCFHLRVIRGGRESGWSDPVCAQLPKPPASPSPPAPPASLPPVTDKPLLHAIRVPDGSLTLDGSTADWQWREEIRADLQIPETSPTSTRGSIYLMWDSQFLYVMALVSDTKRTSPDPANLNRLYEGDSVILELGPERPADKEAWARQADAYYMFGRATPALVGVMGRSSNAQSFEPPMWTTQVQAVFGNRPDGQPGYVLEARIPWADTRLNIFPQPGVKLAANLVVCDRTAPDKTGMVTSNDQRTRQLRAHPAYWQVLDLVP